MSGVVQFLGRIRVELLTPQECRERGTPNVQFYRTLEPYSVVSPNSGRTEIPAGYVTDFGSVPPLARAYISNENPCLNPGSLGHDYDYSQGIRSREECDDRLRECLLACGASAVKAWLVWKSVRLFGASRYNSP